MRWFKALVAALALAGCTEAELPERGFIVFETTSADKVQHAIAILDNRIQEQRDYKVAITHDGVRIRVAFLGDPPVDIDGFARSLEFTGRRLTIHLVDTATPAETFEPGVTGSDRIVLPDDSLGGQLQVVMAKPFITPGDFQGARQDFDDRNKPSVAFQLTPAGAKKLAQATQEHVGEYFAIVLNDRIITAPRIVAPILNGSGQIMGDFTVEEAERLAITIRSGDAPAIRVVEVGAQ